MIDIKFIRENPDLIKAGAAKKRIPCDVDRILDLDQERRRLLFDVEQLRAEQNRASNEIKQLQGGDKQKAIESMRGFSTRLKDLEPRLKEVEAEFNSLLLTVPAPPAEEVPEGESDADNVEIKRWGEVPTFDFEPRDHVVLGQMLDILDIPRGVKLAGSRSYFLKNEGALLELAVLKFALDRMVAKGFVPMIVPVIVNDYAMTGTGYFPLGKDQAYLIERDALNLVGTAEVSLTAYHGNEVLERAELPKHYVGISSCFRREAGTYGKDTQGIYRIHQFQKVEQVSLCENDPAESRREHELLLNNSEEILQALNIPYRVVAVCSGDLGQGQARKNDIESWMPSRGGYGETHSCSTLYDFQSRRLNIRYRDAERKLNYVHTLNNTVVASPRILIPMLELNQQADGSVVIPQALRSYMNGLERIEPKVKL